MKGAIVLVLVVAACEATNAPESAYLPTDVFEDIPAPRDATYRDSKLESFSYRGRSFRCGKFTFDYEGSDADVARFYKETMTAPPYSWTHTNTDRVKSGSTTLTFLKNQDTCTVAIDRVPKPGAGNQRHVQIEVRVNYRR